MMEDVWRPTEEYIASTRLHQWIRKLGFESYEQFYERSVIDLEWFWQEAERELDIAWYSRYTKVLDQSDGIAWPKWYNGGTLNAVHLSVERWAMDETKKDETALVWEGEDGQKRDYTFTELSDEISRVARGLKGLGIKRGEVIALYMPMIPETVIAMMAIAKVGAIFSPIFSGYGADAIAARLLAAEAKAVVTANGFFRRGKEVSLKDELERALALCPTVKKVVVVKRLDLLETNWNEDRDLDWAELVRQAPLKETEKMESSDPLMVLYTSGTTGHPKGTVHTHSGFPLKAAFDAGICMDVRQGDRFFWFTDMGWMMGPFLIYGGLLNGATVVLYEGTPDFPDADRLWQVVKRHNVTHLGISPTLVRGLMKYGEEWTKGYEFEHLRVIASTGEPWNDEPWLWLFEKVGKRSVPIINFSGGTEIAGGILTNVLLRPIGVSTFNAAVPGIAANVFNENGKEVRNDVGELVITKPWVGMTSGFWKEPKRYESSYWGRWDNTWVHGDWVILNERGYWTITGRSDDILTVAGKRLGPSEMETVLVSHSAVHEAGVIGVPDDLKGEVAICFVVLAKQSEATEEIKEELITYVAEKMGKALKPKMVHFLSDLPKTRNGKVMRRLMKAAYLNQHTGDLSALENPQLLEEIREVAGIQ